MKFLIIILLAICAATKINQVAAKDEVLQILNTAKDLSIQELNALRPLFNELQKQYDIITEALEGNGERGADDDVVSWQKEIWPQIGNEIEIDILENMLMIPKDIPIAIEYDTKLPTLNDLIGNDGSLDNRTDLTQEQLMELKDLQQILQETVDDAQWNIDELVHRTVTIESMLLKINKPKIIGYIYEGLSIAFRYSTRLRRAAYCVYSNIPQLNDSLQNINAGVECYKSTTQLILRIQKETVNTVSTIRRNVLDLATVYKKIAAKDSLVGKITTIIMNLIRIALDIQESYKLAKKALDDVENKLPGATEKTIQCGRELVGSIPEALLTITNVTTCITFDDPSYVDFLQDELDYDFNFGDMD